MFEPIAPATLIGRNAPPAIAFGTGGEDEDRFDNLLRESAPETEKPTVRERPERERPTTERREAAPSERPSEPARPAKESGATEAPAAEATDTPATESARHAAPASDAANAAAAPATDTAEAAPAAATAATTAAASAATPVAATLALPAQAQTAPALDAAAKTSGRAAAVPAAPAAGELPTLQQLLAGNGAGQDKGNGLGQDGSGHPQAERNLPPALARLLQPANVADTANAAGAGTPPQSSFKAVLASTALSTSLKPDATASAAANPAALPTAAAAPVNPATAIQPLPSLDPTQPLTGSGQASEAGSGLKQVAALGSTPPRAAQPAATPSLQIAMHIARAAQDGMNKVSVRLDPPELGRVDIKLEVGHDGRVQALVAADRQETLDMLQRDARDLARALKDAGLQADSGNLNFSLRQDGGEGAGTSNGRDAPGDRELHADEPHAGGVAEAGVEAPVTVASDRALDISV